MCRACTLNRKSWEKVVFCFLTKLLTVKRCQKVNFMVIPATAGKGAWNVREPLKDTVSHTLPKVALTAWDRRALATTQQTFSKISTLIGAPLLQSSTAFNSTFLTASYIGMASKSIPQIACGTVLNGVTSLKLHPGLTNEMVEIVGRRRNTYPDSR